MRFRPQFVAPLAVLSIITISIGVLRPLPQIRAQSTCAPTATTSPLASSAEDALFHSGALTPIAGPDGSYFTTVNGTEPDIYTGLKEISPTGQELWSYPLNSSALYTASTGNYLAALYPWQSGWTLATIDMKTHAVQTASLPGPYNYHLAATSSDIVAVGSTGTEQGAQPGTVAVYGPSGQLIKQWSFPDTYSENEVSLTTSGQTTFVLAQLLDSPPASSSQPTSDVIYRIQGTSIQTYELTLPLNVNNAAAVNDTSLLAYGSDAFSTSEIDYISLGQAATVQWKTTGLVAGPIVVNGSDAYVSGVDVGPIMAIPQGTVDPAWILDLQNGQSLGTVQDPGYGIYPLAAGPFGIVAEVHKANSPDVPTLAVFTPTGALELDAPANPNEENAGTGTVVAPLQAGQDVLSGLLPDGTALNIPGTC